MDEASFGDLLGAFFADRDFDGSPIPLPEWAVGRSGTELLEVQEDAIRRQGWDRDMSILGIIHLEDCARRGGMKKMLGPFVTALRETRPQPRLLDFGAGMSAFGRIALESFGAECTFADVDSGTLDYLRQICEAHWPGRTQLHPLTVVGCPISKRARVRIDHRPLVGPFDVIVAADVLEHTLDPLTILTHLYDQLADGGFMYINYPHYIEGDWHTPEAFWLHPWCMRYLRRVCRPEGRNVFRKAPGPKAAAVHLAAKLSAPVLAGRARAFTRRYFREHGEAIVQVVAERAKRQVRVPDLIASVDL